MFKNLDLAKKFRAGQKFGPGKNLDLVKIWTWQKFGQNNFSGESPEKINFSGESPDF